MRNNHWSRMLTAVLTALVLLAGSLMGAAAEGTDAAVVADLTEAEEPVLLVSVNGDEIWSNHEQMLRLQDSYLGFYSSYGYDTSDPELQAFVKAACLEWAVDDALYQQKAAELKVADMTEEQKAALEAQAKKEWDEAVTYYAEQQSGITADSTEEEVAAARANAVAYIESTFGLTEETYTADYVEGSREGQLWKNVQTAVLGEFTVSEEEITAHFNELVEEDKAQYEGNVPMYEYYTNYMGSKSYYVPEGYRGISHILLKVDQDLLSTYTSLAAELEEQKEKEEAPAEETEAPAEETETPAEETEAPAEETEAPAEETAEPAGSPEPTEEPKEPVTQEQVDAAKQAILDSVQAQVDEILAKYAAGTSFRELIAQYGTDPGMLSEQARQEYVDESSFKDLYAKYGLEMLGENAEKGYAVHTESILWDPAFRDGAMKLEKIGDVSEPVLGSNGIHLLHYTRDIPAGAVELTEALRDQLKEEILSEKESTAVAAMVEEWRNAAEIIYTPEGQAILDAANNQNEESVETTEATEETLADGE